MGYDYPECMACYGNDGFNEYGKHKCKLCKDCLSHNINVKLRMKNHLEETYSNVVCDLCYNFKDCYLNIPLCEMHFYKLEKTQI